MIALSFVKVLKVKLLMSLPALTGLKTLAYGNYILGFPPHF